MSDFMMGVLVGNLIALIIFVAVAFVKVCL